MDITPTKDPHWYVIHTYSGYENRVKDGIEKTVKNRNMSDKILDIRVPTREVTETKNGKTTVSEKKIFPGYVMIKMFLDNKLWYVIRNTRGVTGFVGPGAEPKPLDESELVSMGLISEPIEEATVILEDFKVGDSITVIDGPLEGFSGLIDEVFPGQAKVRVNLSMFGRQTPTELEFKQIKKIDQ